MPTINPFSFQVLFNPGSDICSFSMEHQAERPGSAGRGAAAAAALPGIALRRALLSARSPSPDTSRQEPAGEGRGREGGSGAGRRRVARSLAGRERAARGGAGAERGRACGEPG